MRKIFLLFLAAFAFSACQSTYRTTVDNTPGRPTVYEDPSTSGRLQGIGIEAQDIITMTDKMMRDMLANPTLSSYTSPPRVIVDGAYFRNDGSQRINKDLIADRLRVGLTRAADGRMVFVARHAIEMVEHERDLKRQGIVDKGTGGLAQSTAGADYRMTGSIKDLNQIDPYSGLKARYVQITFEMIDLERAVIVWSGIYEFRKSAQDDIIYRSN